ncbi:MAG TPA: MFS transporter [Ilumatobacter sp.]|nr:MFS transporter [Ilumatobacter sp.]
MWRLLRTNRDLRSLFGAQVVSYMGDWFAYVAFVGLVQDIKDLAILVSMVYVAQALPAFLITPISGPVADRYNRRTVIATVSSLQALAALGLLFVDSVSSLWLGFLCLCVISALGAFVGPSSMASLPNLARDADELATANVLFGSLWGAMLAVGAALGGVVAGVFGRDVAFIANAASFVVAVGLVLLIRRPMQTARDESIAKTRMRPIADMREAGSYARRDKVILALIASKSLFAMGAGIVGLLAVLVTDELGGGDRETGILIAARGAGVAIGPFLAARFARGSLATVLLICGWSGAVFGASYVGVALAPWFLMAFVLVLVAHLGGGAQWMLSTYGLQTRAPDHVRGRILAGDFGIVTLIITVSNLIAGALADVVGARPAIAVFAVISIVATPIYLIGTRAMRAQLAAQESPPHAPAPAR